jgi:hypothetical protein
VLVRATEFDPANRYASARDLRSAIEAALQTQHGSTPAPKVTPAPGSTTASGVSYVPVSTTAAGSPPTPSTIPIPGTTPGAATSNRKQATNTQTHDANRTKNRMGDILNTIGRVWNAIVVVVWVLMTISVIVNIVQPRGKYLEYPGWFNALMFLGLLYVPWTLLSYLLLDKRRLRQREPFSRWTWRKELPVCLGVSAACMAVVVILYYALFNQGR